TRPPKRLTPDRAGVSSVSLDDSRAGRDIHAIAGNYIGTQVNVTEATTPQPKPKPFYLPAFNPGTFVGRGEDLARLRSALVPRAGMFLVTGEPGSGKSTLALQFACQAQEDNCFEAVVFQICARRSVETIVSEL